MPTFRISSGSSFFVISATSYATAASAASQRLNGRARMLGRSRLTISRRTGKSSQEGYFQAYHRNPIKAARTSFGPEFYIQQIEEKQS